MNQRKLPGIAWLLVTFLLAGSLFAFAGVVYAFAPDTDLSNADASFWGEDGVDFSGGSVASAGDVNGDGRDDFLIGAYGDDDGGDYAGQTYLILGRAAADWGMDFDLSNVDASFWGEDAGDYSGWSVASAGDVNGDGYDDFLIGAFFNDDGGDYAGQTYLILGRAAADWGMDFDLSSADASFWGEDSEDYSGRSVASAGDVNGDGRDDFLIGAFGDEDGGGDYAGQTYLILGRAAADWGMDFDLSNADASFIGEDEYDGSGRSVASAGDVNSDGYDDFLISAVWDEDGGGDRAGQTYLVLGCAAADWGMDFDLSSADASFWGEDSYDRSGGSVASAGDVNGDGRDDFLIGAYGDEDGGEWAGQSYLILGRAAADWGMDFDLSNADASFWGEDSYDSSGGSVASAGDVNGDGGDDFLIGAYGDEDGGGTDAGQTYLILGRAAADWGMDFDLSNADASFWGEDYGDLSGWSVASAGDVNGDGGDDFLIGARCDDDGDVYAGQTYLWLGTPPPPPPVPVWSVGDNWVYNCSYENPGGNTEQDTCELEVTMVGEEVVGDEACYKLSGVFDPPATRDAADMPLTLHVGTVDIWTSKAHMEYVKTSSAIAELPGLPSTVTWTYPGDYGWPYEVGETWSASVRVVAGPLDETTELEFKVLGVETITVPAGTFECYHIVAYEPTSPDNYTFEHWFNAYDVKSVVKMIDRFLWAGVEVRELTSYSVGTPPAQYNLTINSTDGGNVTTPGEGTFACYAGEVVDLVVTADTGYQFMNWTGDVSTIAGVDSAATNIIMTGNYSITANFAGGAECYVMRNLPDVTYPGQTFDVYVNFTAPVDKFNAIGLTDLAPDGWEVAVDTAWCTPNADAVLTTDNKAEIAWFGEPGIGFDKGTNFTAMYKVTVPDDAEPGINEFPLGDCSKAWLGYYVGSLVRYTSCVIGEHEMTVTVTIDVMRNLPADALDFDAEYPGDTFDVYVNFTAPVDDFASIGLTDLAPAGWEVQTDVNWCSPIASWTMSPGNKAEYAWNGPFSEGTNFSAKYEVTIPATADVGLNDWPNCNISEAWVEYWFGPKGPYESCITGDWQKIVTVPGKVWGETRDVNGDVLTSTMVILYEEVAVYEDDDSSTAPDALYCNDVDDTGLYWQSASKYCYFPRNTSDMPGSRNPWHEDNIDFSTVALLAAGYNMDFEGDYGLVPRACTMSYAMESVNHWLFVPADDMAVPHPEWQLSNWKAMESVHSWQFPYGCNA